MCIHVNAQQDLITTLHHASQDLWQVVDTNICVQIGAAGN